MVMVPETTGAYERATAVSNALRLLALDLHVPILLVCQVNREAARKDPRNNPLDCNDLRDSGSLENDAAGIMMLDILGLPPKQQLMMTIVKNRYGRQVWADNPIIFDWWPKYARIEPGFLVHEPDPVLEAGH